MTIKLAGSLDVKALGAFYTPDTLADVLADWVVQSPNATILEPSAGDGALLRAALSAADRKFGPSNSIRLLACDINPVATNSVRSWLAGRHEVRTVDFLSLDPASIVPFQGVLANPPFTRNHGLHPVRRQELRDRFSVEGAAGLWVHFLFHACSFLCPGGRLAAVVPAAAAFTRYGQLALSRLCSRFESVELRRIVDKPLWVNGAEERGAIILASGYNQGSCISPLISRWSSSGQRLADIYAGNPVCFRETLEASRPLRKIASLSIGAVTGCNRVFLLNEDERLVGGICEEEVTPTTSIGTDTVERFRPGTKRFQSIFI